MDVPVGIGIADAAVEATDDVGSADLGAVAAVVADSIASAC